MTKKLGTDYDPHTESRKPARVFGWIFDLLFPLVLVAAALIVGGFISPF